MLADLPDGFELDHLDLALEYCTQFRTAVDGGANRGIWSAVMADRFTRVLAFEPEAVNFRSVARLACDRENVEAWRLALGTERAAATLALDASAENTGEWYVAPARSGCAELIETLDSFGLQDLDFLKLDVEGYELFALQGARQTIERCRPAICIEEKWHCERYGVPQGEATRFCESLGYHVVARIGRDVILTC